MTVLVVVFLGLNVPRLFLSFKEVNIIQYNENQNTLEYENHF